MYLYCTPGWKEALRVKCLAEEHNTVTLPGLFNLKFQNVMCICPQVPTFLTVLEVNKQTHTKNNKIKLLSNVLFSLKGHAKGKRRRSSDSFEKRQKI